jgi:hypothetical protein
MGFKSLDDWLDAIGDIGRSQAYGLAGIYRELSQTIPEEAITQMTVANAKDLAKVPVSKRTADLVQAATQLPNKQYRDVQNKVVPNLAIEPKEYKGFQLDASALKVVEEGLALARKNENLETDSAALEFVFAQYVSSEGDTPYYSSAKAVVETVEEQIDPDDLARPPDAKGWGRVLVVVRKMSRVFGLKERRVMPSVAEPVAASKRVQ